jgi:hypothetical protein
MRTSGSMPDRDVDAVMPAVVGQLNNSDVARETVATIYHQRVLQALGQSAQLLSAE